MKKPDESVFITFIRRVVVTVLADWILNSPAS